MRRAVVYGGAVVAACVLGGPSALAGPWEDGMVAYNRADYIPAIHLFRSLAEAGNRKAQAQLGTMYRKGEGVARSAARAFMWFSVAAKGGDRSARARMRAVERTMTAEDLSQARAMAAACEASDYRDCAY